MTKYIYVGIYMHGYKLCERQLGRELNDGVYGCAWFKEGVIEVCRNMLGSAMLSKQNWT